MIKIALKHLIFETCIGILLDTFFKNFYQPNSSFLRGDTYPFLRIGHPYKHVVINHGHGRGFKHLYHFNAYEVNFDKFSKPNYRYVAVDKFENATYGSNCPGKKITVIEE